MNRARTGWVLALAVAWAGLAQAASPGGNPDLEDKHQALVKAGLLPGPQALAEKQAALEAQRLLKAQAPVDGEPEVANPVSDVAPDAFPATAAPEYTLTAAELADKLDAELRWTPRESALWKLEHNLELTPAEKQWLEDEANSAAHKGGGHSTDEGGPDTFGNTWIMTGDEGGPAFSWIDIPEVDRTYITLGDDNFLGPFDMGGVISYYGTSYSQVYIGSNGLLGFNSTSLGNLGNVSIPTAAAPNAIMPILWDDMNPGTGGQVYFGLVAGDFVVTYDAVREFGGTGTFTVQVVFDFDNSDLYFNYAALVAPLDLASCTIGIENETGTDGLLVAFNNAAAVPAAQTTIRFDLAPPPDYALSIAPTSAAIIATPGDNASSQFTLFNAGLLADSYTLATTNGTIVYATYIGGQPASNAGPLAPGESVVIEVLGPVPGDQPSGVDLATVLVESVNSDNMATFTLNTTVFNAAFGGPDNFGNTWTSSAGGDVEYAWVDIPVESRTFVTGLTDDSFVGPFPLGGVISYYGDAYTEIFVGSNGNLGFASASLGTLGNAAIPTANAPNNILPFFWDDMNPVSGGQIYYGTVDGNFVLTFDAVREYSGEGTLTAQVVFDFDSSAIYYNYAALVAPLDVTSCTIGIENETGTDGLQVIFNNSPGPPVAEWTIRFDLAPPPDYAVSISPLAVNLSAGPAQNLSTDITVFNSGLLPDSYTLSVSNGEYITWNTTLNGTPLNNTGVIPPLEGFTFQLTGTVDSEAPTILDSATLTATSDSDGNVGITAPVNTAIFNAAAGGPDAYGNTWVSSAGGDQGYFFVNFVDSTVVTLTDNGVAGPFPLGGVLNWYGVPVTQFYISANGVIGFASTNMTTTVNTILPAVATPNGLIALFWDNMNPATSGTVSYGHDESGNLVVTYANVAQVPVAPGTLTAQVVIDFDDQQVYCNYAQVEGLVLNSCTIGIEDGTGTDGLTVLFNGTPGQPFGEWTVRFDLVPPPAYQMDLTGPGTLQGGSSATVLGNYTIGNAGSADDTYSLSVSGGNLFEYEFQDLEGNPITTLGPVDALSSDDFRLAVTIPADMGGQTETVNIVATSTGDTNVSDTVATVILVVPTSGSDAFGNTWVMTGDPEGPAYGWIDIPEVDRNYLTLGDDQVTAAIDLGGTLTFYGLPYSQGYITSNGLLGFGTLGMGVYTNTALPSTNTPNNMLALFWDDLYPPTGGQVFHGLVDGDFVVTYSGISRLGGTGTLTAQIVLDFDNTTVYYNYASFAGGILVNTCTVGMENLDGTAGLQVLFNGTPFTPIEQTTIRFNLAPPPDYWPSLQDGVTAVGAADSEVIVPMDVTNVGLLQDAYTITATADNGVEVDVLISGQPGSQTPVIQPNASFTFELELSIPEVPGGPNAIVTVTATSVGDTGQTDQTTAALTIVLVQGGPDGGGYFWSTSDADGSVEYEWVTIENPTVVSTLTDDSAAGPFDIGFPWTHYGNQYTQVHIASNGSIGFNATGMNSLGNTNYPTAGTPNDMISFFWDDLNPATAGGVVSYGTQDGMFIVEFNQVFEYGGTGRLTAQVILDTNEEAVRINYQTLLSPLDILSCTIGQENADGSIGFAACYNGTGWLPHDTSSIWFGANVIGPSGPYAVRINPDDVTGVGITGGYAEYEFEVENRGENPSAFNLVGEGNAWDVTYHDIDDDWAEIDALPVVPFDTSFMLGVRVHVPVEPESFTDLLHLTVVSTEDASAWDDALILTASSCSHTSQLTTNVTGNGLFGMDHLMDGDWVSGENMIWTASGVNRMVMENSTTGVVGTISVLPFGHDYLGIAHDSRDGTFWVSYVGGVSHVSATGALIAAFSPALLDAATGRTPTGLAFDGDNNILWAMCAHGAVDEFVRIDVEDAANPVGLNAVNVPWSTPFGSGAAGLDYNEGSDQLVALHTGTGTIECFLDLGDGTVDARGDFCPSGLVDAHGVALHEDGRLFVGWTSGLAHPVEQYMVPCAVTDQDREALLLPTEYELGANFPNPFNPSTVIRYALPAQGMVQMDVYNLIGQHQQTLVSGLRPAGYHEVVFDAGARASGVYFYRLTVTDLQGRSLFIDAGKMIMVK